MMHTICEGTCFPNADVKMLHKIKLVQVHTLSILYIGSLAVDQPLNKYMWIFMQCVVSEVFVIIYY